MHPASKYRELRAKYLAIFYKHGFKKAIYVIEKDMGAAEIGDHKLFNGLASELIFFKNFSDELALTPTLDCGDHCDFAGIYKNTKARFDVTSSLDYKNLDDYSKFQERGMPYYIVLIDFKSQKVERIIDINFPFCPICKGRLINILLEEVEYTRHGTPSPVQKVVTLCSNDYEHIQLLSEYNYHISSIDEDFEHQNLNDYTNNNQGQSIGIDNSLFFSKLVGKKIHACGGKRYTIFDKNGDGIWETKFYWQSDLIGNLFPMSLGIDLEANIY